MGTRFAGRVFDFGLVLSGGWIYTRGGEKGGEIEYVFGSCAFRGIGDM